MGFWGHTCLVVGSDGENAASQLADAIEELSHSDREWMPAGALARIEGSEVVACAVGRHGTDDAVIAALSRAVGDAALVSVRIGDSDVCDLQLLRGGEVQATAVLGRSAWEDVWGGSDPPVPESALVNAGEWSALTLHSADELAAIVDGSYAFVEDGVAALFGRILDHPEVAWMSAPWYSGTVRDISTGEFLSVPDWLVDVVVFDGSTPERALGPPHLVFSPIGIPPLPFTGTVSGRSAILVSVVNAGGAGRRLRVRLGGDAVDSGFVVPTSASLQMIARGTDSRIESDPPSRDDSGVLCDWSTADLPANVTDERAGADYLLGRILAVFVTCDTTTEGVSSLWIEIWCPDVDDPPLRVTSPIVIDERFARLPGGVEGARLRQEITDPHRTTVPEAFDGPFLDLE